MGHVRTRALASALASRWARAAAIVDAHPRHVALTAAVAGLLASPVAAAEAVLLLAAAVAAAVALRPPGAQTAGLRPSAPLALVAGAAVIAGALIGHARLAAQERTDLTPLLGATVTAEVVLLEQPRPVRHGATALAELATPLAGRGHGERVMLRIVTAVAWPPAPTGTVVAIRGRLRALGPFEAHYARRGAHAAITLEAAVATAKRRGGAMGLVDAVRTRAERALDAGLPPAQAALLRGMTLGQDDRLDERTREEFRISSLAHVLAASGQNVALLLALALPLLTLAGLGLRSRLVVCLALIALYVPLAGAGPSIQRAGVMGAATTVAALAGRPASRWYALLLAAAATLAFNPRSSADVGWQLSFAAVVAIALLTAPVAGGLRALRVPAPVADAVAMSFAATLGTAPLLSLHFAQVSLAGLPANVLAAPAIGPITWLGMLAGALGQLSPDLALPLNAINAYLLAYVGWVARTTAAVPHASVELALPGPAALAATYAAIAATALAVRGMLRLRRR